MAVPEVVRPTHTGGGKSGKRRISRKTFIAGALFGALGAVASVAEASVIPLGPVTIQPAGIGNVTSILSLQSQGNATDETGRVIWNGTTSVPQALPNPAGSAQPGATTTTLTGGNNNTTATLSTLGVTQASDLRVLLNINEPVPQGDVLLRSLVFNFYDASGAVVYSASLASSLNLTQIQSGIGVAGYSFGLDAAQAAQLQALFSPNLRLGISASLSNAQGGFENFFAGSARTITPSPGGEVSEPGTLALLGLALGGLAFLRRKKAR